MSRLRPAWPLAAFICLTGCQIGLPTAMEPSECADPDGPAGTPNGKIIQFNEASMVITEAPPSYAPSYGLMTATGKTILPATYYDIGAAFGDYLMVICQSSDGQDGRGYVDQTGKEVVPARFSFAYPPTEGLAAVGIGPSRSESRYGYIDTDGTFLIPPTYIKAQPFKSGLAPVETEQGWTIIDKSNVAAFEPLKLTFVHRGYAADHDDARDYPDLFEVGAQNPDTTDDRRPTLYGVIDADGKTVVPIRYRGTMMHDNHISVTIDAPKRPRGYLVGIYDFNGEVLIPAIYDGIQPLFGETGQELQKRFGAPLYRVRRGDQIRIVTNGDKPVTDWFADIEAYHSAYFADEITFLRPATGE